MYGDLSESKIQKYLRPSVPRVHYRGAMSFYPLVDRVDVLQELDGWMKHTVFTSLRKRGGLLSGAGYGLLPDLHGLNPDDLTDFRGISSGGDVLDLRLPSFVRMGKLLRRASQVHGPIVIGHPRSDQYYLGF